MTLAPSTIIGSWDLVSVELLGDNIEGQPQPFGGNPQGILHYLPDGRMAAMIQHASRPAIPGGRQGGTDAQWRSAARSFTAYAGRYTILPGQIVHHVDFNSFPNDVGIDYLRIVHFENGSLILETPRDLPDQRAMRLVWRALPAQS